jgi:cytosine/adenosine deaminase-related metal-dependent hydrolase
VSDTLLVALQRDRFVLRPELVLTPDGPKRGHALVVAQGRIAFAGPAETLAPEDVDKTVDLPGHAVIPGFVDAHTHLGQTFGKSLIGGEPAQIWRRLWVPMEAEIDTEGAYVSAKWQLLELARGGCTGAINYALNDAERNAAVHRAAREVGMRLVSATGLDEFAGGGEDGPRHPITAIYDRISEHIEQCRAVEGIYPSVCNGSFYGSRPETLAAISAYCQERGTIYQIHANEHFPEVHDCILRFGKRPIELLYEAGVLGPHVLLHHTTLATDREIEMLQRTGTAVSYNPVASQWKGNAVAPALAYAARGVRMGIGSDNTRADGFRMLDAAEHSQRLTFGMRVIDFSCGAAWTWVDALTRGSSDAAGWRDGGTLAAGNHADLLILDMERPETMPSWDFEWELVRYYNRDQVVAVMVGGKPIIFGGRPVGWDDRAFIRDNLKTGIRVGTAPGITRVHGASGLYRKRPS